MGSIVLMGVMAAGKSSVSAALVADHGFTSVGFGDVVRAVARDQGVDPTGRAVLQGLGQQLVTDMGPDGFVELLMQAAGTPGGRIVVDGVRHVAVLDSLTRRLANALTVFLEADATDLERRWANRRETLGHAAAASHPVEGELSLLRERADITCNTSRLAAATVAAMLATAARARGR